MQMHEHVLSFRIANQDAGEVYIDIAKSMTILNRKLFRQQGLWHVHGVCTYAESDYTVGSGLSGTTGVPYTVSISGAPRNWVTRNSLVKGFEHWKDQQKKAYDASSTAIKPKWQDFKVWLNESHRTGTELVPTSGHMFGGVDPYIAGEWAKSKIVYVYDDGAGNIVQSEPELHILGPDNGSTNKGLILQYQESRPAVQSPDPLLDAQVDSTIYALSEGSFGDQIEEITENLLTDNNDSPYSQTEYPGNDSNGTEPLLYAFGANANTSKRKLALNGFAAPNGLLEIQFAKEVGNDPNIEANSGEFWIQLFVSHREAY